jgi:hypothetical protein
VFTVDFVYNQGKSKLFNQQNRNEKNRICPMNIKNLLLTALVGGLVTEVLTNVPILNLLTCIICVSFWIGPLLAVWLFRRLEGHVTLNQGMGIGTLAGVIAGIIGFILSFVNMAGVGDLPEIMRSMPGVQAQDLEQMKILFSGPMLIIFNLMGVAITIFFGFIGGLIGGAIFRQKKSTTGE